MQGTRLWMSASIILMDRKDLSCQRSQADTSGNYGLFGKGEINQGIRVTQVAWLCTCHRGRWCRRRRHRCHLYCCRRCCRHCCCHRGRFCCRRCCRHCCCPLMLLNHDTLAWQWNSALSKKLLITWCNSHNFVGLLFTCSFSFSLIRPLPPFPPTWVKPALPTVITE